MTHAAEAPVPNPDDIVSEPQKYQDYVIKDGRFVGRFDEMYRHFDDPWHQSEPRVAQESYSRWATTKDMDTIERALSFAYRSGCRDANNNPNTTSG